MLDIACYIQFASLFHSMVDGFIEFCLYEFGLSTLSTDCTTNFARMRVLAHHIPSTNVISLSHLLI